MNRPLEKTSASQLLEALSIPTLLLNKSGRIIESNKTAQHLLGYSEVELLELGVESLIPIDKRSQYLQDREGFYKYLSSKVFEGKEHLLLTHMGEKIPVDILLNPISIENHIHTLVIIQSSEKRLQTEHELRANQERLQLAKHAAKLGIFDFNPRDNSIHCDERMNELFGVNLKHSISYQQIIGSIHQDDLRARNEAYSRALDPDGNGEYRTEYRITNNVGEEKWLSVTGQMYFKNRIAVRLVGIVKDITEEKAHDQIIKQHQEDEKNITKQQIARITASAIAHELNQPLAAISAYGDVALHIINESNFGNHKLKRALEGAITQAQRAGNRLHELLAFLQEGELITEPFQLNQAIIEAISISKSDNYIKDIKITTASEDDLPDVIANRAQILKVLVNLLRNASEAMRNEGFPDKLIHIRILTCKKLKMAQVCVQDNGPGITPEIIGRIFEPFFTTKPSGIGMGLAISRTLIETNGGHMWIESNSPKGASFFFTLPFAS